MANTMSIALKQLQPICLQRLYIWYFLTYCVPTWQMVLSLRLIGPTAIN